MYKSAGQPRRARLGASWRCKARSRPSVGPGGDSVRCLPSGAPAPPRVLCERVRSDQATGLRGSHSPTRRASNDDPTIRSVRARRPSRFVAHSDVLTGMGFWTAPPIEPIPAPGPPGFPSRSRVASAADQSHGIRLNASLKVRSDSVQAHNDASSCCPLESLVAGKSWRFARIQSLATSTLSMRMLDG